MPCFASLDCSVTLPNRNHPIRLDQTEHLYRRLHRTLWAVPRPGSSSVGNFHSWDPTQDLFGKPLPLWHNHRDWNMLHCVRKDKSRLRNKGPKFIQREHENPTKLLTSSRWRIRGAANQKSPKKRRMSLSMNHLSTGRTFRHWYYWR